jgi:hypothetical protein
MLHVIGSSLLLLECENTLVGIFVTVIAIVFDHAPAENFQSHHL